MTPMKGQVWQEWLAHPQTQIFLQQLKDSAHDSTIAWANGSYESDNQHVEQRNDQKAKGNIQCLLLLIESIEDINKEDEESGQPATERSGDSERASDFG